MGAQIKITQVGLSAGVADRSRSDGLDTGAVVTLESAVPGATNTWKLLWVPRGDTTAVASLVASGTTVTFTPSSFVYGTYRILLTVDEGLPTQSYSIRTFSIRSPVAQLRIPALNERASYTASLEDNGADQIDASETNEAEADAPFVSGSYGGWYSAFEEVFLAVEALAYGVTRVLTGSTPLTVSTITDGQFLKRVGTNIVSASVPTPSSAAPTTGIGAANAEGVASTYALSDHNHKLRTGSTDLTIGTITDGEFLKRSGTTIISAPAGLTVKDEGTNLSTAVTSIDFVGGGVTATGTTAATVTIPQGGRVTARRTVTGPASVVLAVTDHLVLVDTSAGAVTLTLPTPVGSDSIYEIKDIAGTFGTNACTLARNAVGDYIEGLQASYALEAPWQATRIASDNSTKWYLL